MIYQPVDSDRFYIFFIIISIIIKLGIPLKVYRFIHALMFHSKRISPALSFAGFNPIRRLRFAAAINAWTEPGGSYKNIRQMEGQTKCSCSQT